MNPTDQRWDTTGIPESSLVAFKSTVRSMASAPGSFVTSRWAKTVFVVRPRRAHRATIHTRTFARAAHACRAKVGMLVTGTINTLSKKAQNQSNAPGLDGESEAFHKPWFQSAIMFAGACGAWPRCGEGRRRQRPCAHLADGALRAPAPLCCPCAAPRCSGCASGR
jgi:hypothetical protein